MRHDARLPDQMRPVTIEPNYLLTAEGSALISVGNTKVLCTASVEDSVPSFLRGSGKGWVTAEYAMLPRATATRTAREVKKGRESGRTMEIQRLIGRALRSVVNLPALGFGMGDVVLLELLKARGKLPSFRQGLDAVVIIEDEGLRAESLALVQRLRESGRAVDYSLTPAKGDKQWKRAIEQGARHGHRVERDAGGAVVYRTRHLATRTESVGDLASALAAGDPAH